MGTPRKNPAPMKSNEAPKSVTGKPPVQSMVKPRAMLNMPRVATNGGRRNFVMTKPLNQPSTRPARMPATMAPKTVNWTATPNMGRARPFLSRPAAKAPAKARIAPTDKSIPPVMMTRVMPMDRHKLTEICSRMLRPFANVRNLSDIRLSATTITTSATRGWSFLMISLVFIGPVPGWG